MREVALLAGLLGVYEGARVFGGHDASAARRHAHDLLHVERWLHLPAEQHLQSALLHVGPLTRAANGFYASAHLPVTILSLLWLLVYRHDVYRRTRRALVGATAIALALYLALPVAPPRMLPGFVDTAARDGQSVYGGTGVHSLADQYAAFPSLHVGWAVLIAIAMITANRTRWRWLWLLHPAITTLVVVSTGNHYWLDAIAGGALTLGAFAACGVRDTSPGAVRGQDRRRGPGARHGLARIRRRSLGGGVAARTVGPTAWIPPACQPRRAALVDVPAIVAMLDLPTVWSPPPAWSAEVTSAAVRMALAHVGLDEGEVWVLAEEGGMPQAAVALLPPPSGPRFDDLLSALHLELGVDSPWPPAGAGDRITRQWNVLQGSRMPAGSGADDALAELRSRALAGARARSTRQVATAR